MNLKNYPELRDFIQDVYFEDRHIFETVKQFVEQLNDIITEPGLNQTDIQFIIQDALDQCLRMENEDENKPESLEVINHRIREMQNGIFAK